MKHTLNVCLPPLTILLLLVCSALLFCYVSTLSTSHPKGNNIVLDISLNGANLPRESSSQEIVVRFSGPKAIRRTIPITIVRD